MFAKNEKIKNKLQNNWNKIVYKRGYLAIIEGRLKEKSGTIKNYLDESKTIQYYLDFFQDFYADFRYPLALQLLQDLKLQPDLRLKDLSKGNKEKVQLILVMSREAKLYLLDEPIGGVDPASRDYILKTIINQYSEDASVIISTHLIADIESVLDEVVFLKYGQIELQGDTDNIRQAHGKSIDKLFREMFHN